MEPFTMLNKIENNNNNTVIIKLTSLSCRDVEKAFITHLPYVEIPLLGDYRLIVFHLENYR